MCEIFSIFQDEEGSLVLAKHSKVEEKCFNWTYGSTCSPEVEVNTHTKGSLLDYFRVTFRSCGLSLLSMEISSIDRWQSLSYWVSEVLVILGIHSP